MQRRALKCIHSGRCPCSLTHLHTGPALGLTQDTHLLYVLAAANLYARVHGLPGSRDQPALREMLPSLLLPEPQHLHPIFPNDLASTEPGKATALPTPMLPPKSSTPPSAWVEEQGAWGPCSQLTTPQALWPCFSLILWPPSRPSPCCLPHPHPHPQSLSRC